MERMTREEFRHWFAKFSRPRAIWIQHSGWVPGTTPNPVPEATAQRHMEEIVLAWADAIKMAGWVECTSECQHYRPARYGDYPTMEIDGVNYVLMPGVEWRFKDNKQWHRPIQTDADGCHTEADGTCTSEGSCIHTAPVPYAQQHDA